MKKDKETTKPAAPAVIVSFTELESLSPADLFAEGASIPRTDKAVEKAKQAQISNLHKFGKVVAALKRLHIRQIYEKQISPGLPFSSKKKDKPGFFELNCKGSLPPRVEAIAALFNTLCLTNDANGKPLLPESFYDAAKVDWLEKANAILSRAMKDAGESDLVKLMAKGGEPADAVLDTINALAGKPFKPGDTAGTLKEIKARQTGKAEDETEDGEESHAVPLTLGRAVEFIKAAFAAAATASKDSQVELCVALYEIEEAWAQNDLTENRRNDLDKQVQAAMASGIAPTIQITRGEAVAA